MLCVAFLKEKTFLWWSWYYHSHHNQIKISAGIWLPVVFQILFGKSFKKPPNHIWEIVSIFRWLFAKKSLNKTHWSLSRNEYNLNLIPRFFWLAAFGCSLIGAAFFIMNVYNKWSSSPMIVSINPQNMAMGNLPFPALTICNVNQAKKSVAERYMDSG